MASAIVAQPWGQPALLLPPAPEHWVSYSRALQLCDRTAQWFSQQVREGRVLSRDTNAKLPNGRYAREFAVSSLPQDARKRYEAEQARQLPSLQNTLPLFGVPHLVKPTPRVMVPKGKEPEADKKQRILRPILEMQDERFRRVYADSLSLTDGRRVDSINRMIEYQVEQYRDQGVELNSRTLKRWIAAHKAEGTAGLVRHKRRDAGRSRFFERPENRAAAALVAYLHLGDGLTPGLSVQACYDMLLTQRKLVGLESDELPHYDTVRLFLAKITPALKVYATRGYKEFAERMMPYISRAYNEHANSIWVSDTMIADVEVLNDCIPGAPLGAPIRLRLTAIIDYRSRYVVGYSWAWEGSSASIARAIRFAVQEHGPCDLWYCDNGKDYCKVAKGAVPGYMQPGSPEELEWVSKEMRSIEDTGVLARLGVRVTHCLAHHPQSKHVERFFRTLHLTFCKLWQTYTGGKPSERPDQTTALMHVHRKAMRKGDLTKSHHPLASHFMRAFDEWLPTYHAHRHGGRGMAGRSPAEVFRAERNPAQRPAPSPEALVPLMWDCKRAKVRECQVHINKHDYAPTNALQARLMMDRNDRWVTVAYDPLDPGCVAILDEAGHLVTLLDTKRLIRQAPDDPETQEQIAAMMQMRGELRRSLRDDRNAITRAGKQLDVVHPLQLLASCSEVDSHDPERVVPRKPALTTTSVATPVLNSEDIGDDLAARLLRRRN